MEIAALLHLQQRRLATYVERSGVGGLKKLFDSARGDLRDRLQATVTHRKGNTFQTTQLRSAMVQVDVWAKQLKQKSVRHIMGEADFVQDLAIGHLVKQVRDQEKQFTGASSPLSIEEAGNFVAYKTAERPTLLRRFDNSMSVYGAQSVSGVERILATGLLTAKPVDDVIEDVAGRLGFLDEDRWRAERIVRTELIGAYNFTNHGVLADIQQNDFPDMQKKWCAHLDVRTSTICEDLNDTIRSTNGAWVIPGRKGAERFVAYPPAHPNCRCTICAWRRSWGSD